MPIGPDAYREIGRVIGAKGVRGELKIAPDTDDPTRLLELASMRIGQAPETAVDFDIVTSRIQPSRYGPTLVVLLRGVVTRTDAEKLRKRLVFAPESELPALGKGEFFVSDLVGLDAGTSDGDLLGAVIDVYDLPAQQILLVRLKDGRDVMIPAVPEFLIEVDMKGKRVVVKLMEGLI